jgi:tRNA acetyltransferase TAN1
MTGILISCTRSFERRSISEIMQLFNDVKGSTTSEQELTPFKVADRRFPKKDVTSSPEKEETIEDAIQKELQEMKNADNKSVERFTSVRAGVECIHFVKINDESLSPVEFCHSVFKDSLEYGKARTRYHLCNSFSEKILMSRRFSSRLIPFSESCYASMKDIELMCKRIVEKFIPGQESCSVCRKPRIPLVLTPVD